MSTAIAKNLLSNPEPELIDQAEIPVGKKIINWEVQFSNDAPELSETLEILLATLHNHDFDDDLTTTALQYKWFKDEGQEQLFHFLVYRKTEINGDHGGGPTTVLEGNIERPSRTPGPPTVPPPSVIAITVIEINP